MRLKLDFSSFFLNKFQQFLKISGFLEIQMLSLWLPSARKHLQVLLKISIS